MRDQDPLPSPCDFLILFACRAAQISHDQADTILEIGAGMCACPCWAVHGLKPEFPVVEVLVIPSLSNRFLNSIQSEFRKSSD